MTVGLHRLMEQLSVRSAEEFGPDQTSVESLLVPPSGD